MTLDGIPTTNYAFSSTSTDISKNVLASFTDLSYAEHVVQLTLLNPDLLFDGSVLLQFDRADITGEVPPNPALSGHSSLK